jgi:hypothetical protein
MMKQVRQGQGGTWGRARGGRRQFAGWKSVKQQHDEGLQVN